MSTFKDVFISYGRADSKALASQLSKRLSAMGVSVWFDFDDIPLATDFQERIDNGIARAHNFLYIISPSSVNSPYCDKELQLALKYGKRIIPLMHVEEISAQTWKRRNPQGTKAEWQAFKAAGKHRSFENLNETARKLNWVAFRPGDDVKTWLQNLAALFHQEQDYVQHHTQLLTQALDWARHHRQTRYLLVGTERQEAETWLQSRLTDEALPYPSPVHCEFITESIKNANNLMTQVFLCHSDNDQDSAEQIRQSLLRRGITVWNYRTDIQTSQDYTNAIAQGIEEADNIIFMLSPHSANSSYCQYELKQALSLHKRVIPVLAAPVEPEQVPASLRSLQYINLTDNAEGIDDTSDDAERLKRLNYQSDESELLKLLDSDAAYHAEHKTWLTQALKWERQQHEPAMLLRGYNLHQAENWLKVARNHSYPPTELQAEFIADSLRQPPSMSSDVFISYSRVDSDFARRLNEALQIQGKRTWFDQESIAKGTDFQQEIYRGIESSDVFLFVLSPQSISSPYCADEVEYADRLNKRIVTVLHRPIDTDDLHPVLKKIDWLDFRDHDGDFQVNFQHLLRTLDTDRAHLEVHTRLLGRALEWDRSSRDESLLLRGKDLDTAEQWLKENAEIEPKPTGLQQEYVRASRAREDAQKAAERKLRRGTWIGGVAATVGIAMAVVAGWLAKDAANQRQLAQTATRLELAGVTAYRRLEFDQVGALLKAIEAGRELETVVEKTRLEHVSDYPAASPLMALRQIQQATTKIPNRLLAHEDWVNHASFSPDGQQMVMASMDGTARLWNLETGESIVLEGHEDTVYHASFSPDGQQVVTASRDGTARLWSVETGESTVLEGHEAGVFHASFSPDGQQVMTASGDGTARLWNLETGASTMLEGHEAGVFHASFSPDGQQVVTASMDGAARLWTLETGESTVLEGHEYTVYHASFSPDGQQVVTASMDGTARLWSVETGESIVLEGHEERVLHASFSPDGQQVVTASMDSTARLWSVETGASTVLEGHEDWVEHASFSPDGQQVMTASGDGTARLWSVETGESTVLEGHEEGVEHASFSPDGQQVLTASWDDTARLWNLETGASIVLEGHENGVHHASFSPNGQQVVTASWNGAAARLWSVETGASIVLEGHENGVYHASFSPNGQQVVTASNDDTARLWSVETGESTVLEGHEGPVGYASFSPNGQQVLTASSDSTARLWSVETGESTVLEGHEEGVFHASFSPDGQQVVTASRDGTARLWNLETGESTVLKGHDHIVYRASFSPNGQQVVTASEDGTARLWSVKTGESIVLEGHEDAVTQASFSPDGQQVVTASVGGTTRQWDLQGRQLAIFEGEEGVLSPDGQKVATVKDGKVQAYDIAALPELLDWGCEWLHSYLEYGPATDSDRAACNLPPRPEALFEAALEPIADAVSVSWPQL